MTRAWADRRGVYLIADEIAAGMKALAWWDWPHERLHAALADFRALTAKQFLDAYETPAPVVGPHVVAAAH